MEFFFIFLLGEDPFSPANVLVNYEPISSSMDLAKSDFIGVLLFLFLPHVVGLDSSTWTLGLGLIAFSRFSKGAEKLSR